jgi:hypothetical protein
MRLQTLETQTTTLRRLAPDSGKTVFFPYRASSRLCHSFYTDLHLCQQKREFFVQVELPPASWRWEQPPMRFKHIPHNAVLQNGARRHTPHPATELKP